MGLGDGNWRIMDYGLDCAGICRVWHGYYEYMISGSTKWGWEALEDCGGEYVIRLMHFSPN